MFAAVLEDQIARRRHGELPIVELDPAWTLVIDGVDPMLERVHESLLTLADGRLGTRGSVIARHPSGDPAVLMSGVYTRTGAEAHLLAAPRWNTIALDDPSPRSVRRVLDLHAGVLHQQLQSETGRIDALLLSSLARPATAALRVRDRSAGKHLPRPLTPPPGPTLEEGQTRRGHVDARQGAAGVDRRGGARSAARHRRRPSARPPRSLRTAPLDGPADEGAAARSPPIRPTARVRRSARRASARVGVTLGGRRRDASTAIRSCSWPSGSRSSTCSRARRITARQRSGPEG